MDKLKQKTHTVGHVLPNAKVTERNVDNVGDGKNTDDQTSRFLEIEQ
jgi:hypothetical protein